MGNYNGLGDYRSKMERRMTAIRIVLTANPNDRANDVLKAGRKLLSGRLSSKELEERGYPFAKRHYSALGKLKGKAVRMGAVIPTPKLPINIQSGMLYRALKATMVNGRVTVYFDESVAPYWHHVLNPHGTDSMVARGFQKALAKELKTVSPGRRASLSEIRKEIHAIHRRT